MTYHATLSGLCNCGTAVQLGSRATDGVGTEYCSACGIESITTIRGFRQYDQRERAETKMAKKVAKERTSVDTAYQRVRTMHSIDVD